MQSRRRPQPKKAIWAIFRRTDLCAEAYQRKNSCQIFTLPDTKSRKFLFVWGGPGGSFYKKRPRVAR